MFDQKLQRDERRRAGLCTSCGGPRGDDTRRNGQPYLACRKCRDRRYAAVMRHQQRKETEGAKPQSRKIKRCPRCTVLMRRVRELEHELAELKRKCDGDDREEA